MMEAGVDHDASARSDLIVRSARSWIGTPYRHQASLRGVGTDCLGLIRGVWRDVVGPETRALPPYSQSWGESDREERLWRGLEAVLHPVEAAQAGDIALFRMIESGRAKHLAILSSAGSSASAIIHAYSGRTVVETPLPNAWRKRIVAIFRFPERG